MCVLTFAAECSPSYRELPDYTCWNITVASFFIQFFSAVPTERRMSFNLNPISSDMKLHVGYNAGKAKEIADLWITASADVRMCLRASLARMSAHKNEHRCAKPSGLSQPAPSSFYHCRFCHSGFTERSLGPRSDTHRGPNTLFIHLRLVRSAHPRSAPFSKPRSLSEKEDSLLCNAVRQLREHQN